MKHPASTSRYGWRHAAAVGMVANLASALPAGYTGDEEYYASLRTPPGSAPGWLFAPAWAINNALTLWSNLRIANLPPQTPGRRSALAAETTSWVLFSAFTGLYFGLRSPVLGALDTAAGLAVTAYSVRTTTRLDRAAALALAPRLVWLGYATYISVATAVRSPDRLLKPTPRTGRSSRARTSPAGGTLWPAAAVRLRD